MIDQKTERRLKIFLMDSHIDIEANVHQSCRWKSNMPCSFCAIIQSAPCITSCQDIRNCSCGGGVCGDGCCLLHSKRETMGEEHHAQSLYLINSCVQINDLIWTKLEIFKHTHIQLRTSGDWGTLPVKGGRENGGVEMAVPNFTEVKNDSALNTNVTDKHRRDTESNRTESR